ncbi:hypothetical protein KC19_8G053400 [Ceratodon purpureus]|uniref:Uncharacterized protein n=2 Tax=Ceratodon purpureus TaxID=3225 RepID=A0A8T0GXF2_CERPU|nr:hypothetical protein KC19_8G053400 [Ceratodon purpureus]
MDMKRHYVAVVVEDELRRFERQGVLMTREAGRSYGDQGMVESVVTSTSALDFLRRIFARVASYITRVRRLFFFKIAKDGSLEVEKERGDSEISENKVEGGLVEASRACDPDLTEIIVTSPKETTNHGIHDVDTKVVEPCLEDCATKCTSESKDMEEEYSAPLASIVEHTSATEQSTSDPCQQEPQSVACEPIYVSMPELHGEDCTANEHEKCHSLEQTASQEHEQNDGPCEADEEEKCLSPGPNHLQNEELVDAVIIHKSDCLQSLSQFTADNTENLVKGSSDVESLNLTSSRALKRKPSIKELNAAVAEQLTKCLNALERNMVPGKAEHRRAIILATLVAIAVWARNAKHLHQSLPRIRCSVINVHIRSRL